MLEALGNKSNFLFVKGPINLKFGSKNPFAMDKSLIKVRGVKVLSVIPQQSRIFTVYVHLPFGIRESCNNSRGNLMFTTNDSGKDLRLEDIRLRSSLHRMDGTLGYRERQREIVGRGLSWLWRDRGRRSSNLRIDGGRGLLGKEMEEEGQGEGKQGRGKM